VEFSLSPLLVLFQSRAHETLDDSFDESYEGELPGVVGEGFAKGSDARASLTFP
jgi:hypothetical protein